MAIARPRTAAELSRMGFVNMGILVGCCILGISKILFEQRAGVRKDSIRG